MSQSQSAVISSVSSGVDYITLTYRDSLSIRRMQRTAKRVAQWEIDGGNFRNGWRLLGYDGFRIGGLECGERHDGWIVRLSGRTAYDWWRPFGVSASNCSRVDLQVTGRYEVDAKTVLRKHWRDMRRHSSSFQKPPALKQWSNHAQIETIYTGSRKSDVFGRIYDKGVESGLAEYKNHIRYEVEFKADMARLVLNELLRADDHRRVCREQCQALFRNRGCPI